MFRRSSPSNCESDCRKRLETDLRTPRNRNPDLKRAVADWNMHQVGAITNGKSSGVGPRSKLENPQLNSKLETHSATERPGPPATLPTAHVADAGQLRPRWSNCAYYLRGGPARGGLGVRKCTIFLASDGPTQRMPLWPVLPRHVREIRCSAAAATASSLRAAANALLPLHNLTSKRVVRDQPGAHWGAGKCQD